MNPAIRRAHLFPWLEVTLGLSGCMAIVLGPASPVDPTVELEEALFLSVLCLVLGRFVVRLDRGYLRLTMIATQAAAMVLGPPLAGLVGLIGGVSWVRHGPKGHRYAGVGAAVCWTAGAASVRLVLMAAFPTSAWLGFAVVAVLMTVSNWAINLTEHSLLTTEPIVRTVGVTFSRAFVAAFVYFSLAAFLIANLLHGSASGYLLASLVGLLSVALTETLAERRTRVALEAQVADSQRHVGYSRALEGVVHSLRHQLAISKGYLEDVMESQLPPPASSRAQAAKASMDVALQTLDRIQASANPRVDWAGSPVSLKSVASAAIELVRGLAQGKGTTVVLEGTGRRAIVAGDPGLLRDVVTELLLNALDAVGRAGTVAVTVGTRRGGWACLTVSDSGPGVSKDQREHLFEPHFTTKQAGTGMGLFTAFGIVREHGGKLVYEGGGRRGGVFSILIPRTDSLSDRAEPVAVAGDGLNPAMVAERFSR